MKKIKVKLSWAFLLVMLAFGHSVYAQDEDEGPEPPPSAPISDWIPVVAITGIAYAGFYLVRRNAKATV